MLFVLAGLFSKKSPEPLPREALEALEDEDLMLRYAAGEVPAFEILLTRHENRVLNFVYRSVGDRGRAEEITQDVFLKVIRTSDRYTPSAKFTTWLFTIARNACIDEARRGRRRRTMSLDAPLREDEGGETFGDRTADPTAVSGVGELARERFRTMLQEGLANLPDEQREVFVLRHFDGMRFVDIGRMFGISENTVKSRMRYALATLRGYVADFEGFSFDETDDDEVGA